MKTGTEYAEQLADHERHKAERARIRRVENALRAIANSEIPGVSGGPHGPSLQVMEFAQAALREET